MKLSIVFENQFKAEQSLSCKWSVKLAQKSYVYKIFIKGAAFGECNQEVSKLSGKIWNLWTLYFSNFYFLNLFKVKNDGKYVFRTCSDEPNFMGTFSGTEITIDLEGKSRIFINSLIFT